MYSGYISVVGKPVIDGFFLCNVERAIFYRNGTGIHIYVCVKYNIYIYICMYVFFIIIHQSM